MRPSTKTELDVASKIFLMFDEKMNQIFSVLPPSHSDDILSGEWFSYVDSLAPEVEAIRFSTDKSLRKREDHAIARAMMRLPVLNALVERINRGAFDRLVINDPWGPNLILVSREFAMKALSLGGLP